MVDATHKSFDASDRSYFALIKKEAHALAVAHEFSEKRTAELDIIVAELTSNLYKYAKGGEILIGAFGQNEATFIELICLDDGPGIADLSRVMADGYSTTNTMGHGLGSIKRLSDEFDIYSARGSGTILVSRVHKNERPGRKVRHPMQVRGIVVAKPGESISGDGCYFKSSGNFFKMMLADGLGHGPEANLAVNEAVKAFKTCPFHSPVEIIRYIHPEVRKTRGLVGTIIVFNLENKTFSVAGVGNISLKMEGPLQSKNQLSYNGIIGHNIPNTMNDLVQKLTDYNHFTLCSDGIKSRWDLQKYPGINRTDLTIQAAAIYKEFSRRTDDMSVLIVKTATL